MKKPRCIYLNKQNNNRPNEITVFWCLHTVSWPQKLLYLLQNEWFVQRILRYTLAFKWSLWTQTQIALILQFAVRAFTAIRAINTISGCLTNQIQTYSRLYFYILMVVRNILLNASLSTPVISLEDFCDLDSLLINQTRGVVPGE